MTTKTFVDAEAAAKAWARATTTIAALVGGRVFLGVNDKGDGSFPQLVVTRVGGGPEDGDAPLDDARIQFDCWATSRHAAANLAYTVQSAAESMTGRTPMGAAAVADGARTILGPLFATTQADETARRYRYLVDVQFTIKAA